VAYVPRHSAKEIEADWEVGIGRIEVNNIVRARWRNVVKQFFREIAVWIDDTYAFTGFDVLENEISQQRRLSASSFAEAVHMVPTVSARKTKRLFSSPHVSMTEIDNVVFAFHGSGANGYSGAIDFSGLRKRNGKALATNVLCRAAKVIAACFGP
jgi:hypothetical protein